jgi:hypothetical protein
MGFKSLLLGASFALTIACCANPVSAHKVKDDLYDLKINGIPFHSNTKQVILKKFGTPLRQFAPHYECGFYSDDQGQIYYALQYKTLDWIGNTKEGYMLEDVFISPNAKYVITYKGKKLSSETTPKEFMKLSGMREARTNVGGENPDDLIKFIGDPKLKTISVDLTDPQADDKRIFYFYKGKLCKIEYWSPC